MRPVALDWIAPYPHSCSSLNSTSCRLKIVDTFRGERLLAERDAQRRRKVDRRARHDRASELDSWDCVDELVAEEDYSQEWGEAASR